MPVEVSREVHWPELAALLTTHKVGTKQGPAWMPARIEPGPRRAERIQAIRCAVLDIDQGTKTPELVAADLKRRGVAAAIATSHSHKPSSPKFRITIPLSRDVTRAEVRPLLQQIAHDLGLSPDPACMESARLYYLPRHPEGAEHEAIVVDGEPWVVPEVAQVLSPPIKQARPEVLTAEQMAALQSALGTLSSDDYELWIAVGQALHGLGEAGRSLWEQWSQRSDKWQDKDAAKWFTFEGNRTGWRAVLFKAKSAGWINPANRGATASPAALTPLVQRAGVALVRGDSVKLEPVRWLWPDFLPAGMFTILGGAPGCGKTTLALSLAATVTTGGQWPCGARSEQLGDVLIWSGEDAPSVLAARLKAAGADMRRVHFIAGFTDGRAFDPGRDMPALEAKAAELIAPRLLILDPVVSAVTGDSHKGAEVRRSLQPVVTLGQRLGCAVLGITHFTKGTAGTDPVERVTGSIAFAALARMVLVAAKVKTRTDQAGEQRVFMRAKSNIGPDSGGFGYALERVAVAPEVDGQRVRWLERLEGSARELLAQAEAEVKNGSAADDAASLLLFLRDLLRNGPLEVKAIKAEVIGAGYPWATVDRTARSMGIVRKKTGMRGGWSWELPVTAVSDENSVRILSTYRSVSPNKTE